MGRQGTLRLLRASAAASIVGLVAAGPGSGALAQDVPELPLPDLSVPGLGLPGPAPSGRKAVGVTPEVTAFAKRLAGCRRLGGEDGDEAERAAEVARERFRLRCSTVEQDEARLRARYARSPGALEALDRAGD